MGNILSVANSALNAAQVGLTTTGHNIANANTPGFSRQIVVQGTATSQDVGYGFEGKGTQIATIKRVYDEYLASRVLTSNTSSSELSSYYNQIKQVNNMFADATVGLSPSLQEFFKSVQAVAADPNSNAARQTLLSSAETMVSQFKSVNSQLNEMKDGVNQQITTSVQTINGYAQQIARLNDAIEKAQGSNDNRPANDLLDQRDQIVSELSKEIKVSVVKQGSTYNVFIGNGQPLVVSANAFSLVSTVSPTDLGRAEVGYVSNGQLVVLAEAAIDGGKLGGIFDFRANTLDVAQNRLGQMAIGLATTFNAQHQLGQDQNGNIGGNFFNVGSPVVTPSALNTSNAQVSASVADVNALTVSDYQLEWDGTNFVVTRLSDKAVVYSNPVFPTTAIDGVTFNLVSGTPNAGDTFLVRPTVEGAAGLGMAISDKARIAAAGPIRTSKPSTNNGNGTISPGTVDATYAPANLATPVTLTYSAIDGSISGFPAAFDVTVTVNGVATTSTAPVTSVPYTPGATISFGGASFVIDGTLADGDSFTIGQNANGVGDNRNILLLAKLQSANTLDNGTSSFQGVFAQMVSTIGNKTHELEVIGAAENALLTQAIEAHQANSGVNLDEEATNLLRYQQAYIAAGKVMQTARELFDVLLSLG